MKKAYPILVSITPELEAALSGKLNDLSNALQSTVAKMSNIPGEHLDVRFAKNTRVTVVAPDLNMSADQKKTVQAQLEPILIQAAPMSGLVGGNDVTVGLKTMPNPQVNVIPNGELIDRMSTAQVQAVQAQLQPVLLEQAPMKDLVGDQGVSIVISPSPNQPIPKK